MAVESATKEDFRIGDQMPDGTVYAGISPDTNNPMYATPKDAPGRIMSVESTAKTTPRIGDEMEDGTILAGYYEGKPLYATPADALLPLTFNGAQKYASKLDAHSQKDWHVPTKGELNVLWETGTSSRPCAVSVNNI